MRAAFVRTVRRTFAGAVLAPLLCLPRAAAAQSHITSPKEALGANFGDDYFLANYTQIAAYWRTL